MDSGQQLTSDSSELASSPQTIFVFRHAEKPEELPGSPLGVDIGGRENKASLTPRGWQRAGALGRLLAPRGPVAWPGLLIAPLYRGEQDRHRTHQTIRPLSELTELEVETPFAEGQEAELARYISGPAIPVGVVLICWEHKGIPHIAQELADPHDVPANWPARRFDVVWSLVRPAPDEPYAFSQIPQMLLFGDEEAPIPLSPDQAEAAAVEAEIAHRR